MPTLAQFTIDLLTGTTMAGLVEPRARTPLVVERWKQALRILAV
ncbi:hypothetical protein [Nocardioides sp. SYSU D00038]|nr:hypothetical protein [Nocardioides sp. SYSU D00038]